MNIEPGATLLLDGNYSFSTGRNRSLLCQGTETDSIKRIPTKSYSSHPNKTRIRLLEPISHNLLIFLRIGFFPSSCKNLEASKDLLVHIKSCRICVVHNRHFHRYGGASKVPTFVALLGNHLDVTVLVDADTTANQRILDMVNQGLLKEEKLITVGDVTGATTADIEDLFEANEYLMLYNQAFGKNLKITDLSGTGPIVKKISRVNGHYDHGKPAEILLRSPDQFLSGLTEATIDRFDFLFKRLNATLGTQID